MEEKVLAVCLALCESEIRRKPEKFLTPEEIYKQISISSSTFILSRTMTVEYVEEILKIGYSIGLVQKRKRLVRNQIVFAYRINIFLRMEKD